MRAWCSILAFFSSGFLVPAAPAGGGLELLSVACIWNGARHNAFTDLARYHSQWFCTFREADGHVRGNGKIRVLNCSDGLRWDSAALLEETGIDLRDPKLSVTADNRLMLVMGGSVYDGKTLKERRSRVAFSADGAHWTSPKPVLELNDWLWRVTWHKDRAYGVAYNAVSPGTNQPGEWSLKLVSSLDGVNFQTVANLAVPGRPNETTLRFLANGDCVALVRREGPGADKDAWIGTSSAPYTQWKWKSAGMQIGGPNFIVLPGDRLLASGRRYGPKPDPRTFVGRMDLNSVTPDLVLPSGGDCSYAGMVLEGSILWLSYYSSHESKTGIFLAKIRCP